jgi:hypothetical protein
LGAVHRKFKLVIKIACCSTAGRNQAQDRDDAKKSYWGLAVFAVVWVLFYNGCERRRQE